MNAARPPTLVRREPLSLSPVKLGWQTRDGVPLLMGREQGAVIAFTTRLGGVSQGALGSLNLGFATPDDPADVAENRRRALAAAGAEPGRAVSLYQRHGRDVLEARSGTPGAYLDRSVTWPDGDALVTSEPRLPLIAHGADCLTVALVAAGGGRVATVHAGWRGLVAGVLEAAAAQVGPAFSAAIGPGAGACCYAVGADVAEPLRERFGVARRARGPRRPRPVRAPSARARGRGRDRARRAVHDLRSRALPFAPPRRPPERPAGRDRLPGGGPA